MSDSEENVRYASLSYSYDDVANIGDEIQSLAAEQFLPRIDRTIDRESLASFSDAEHHRYVTILNGWFARTPARALPPAPAIEPVLVSFHLRPSSGFILDRPDVATYLTAHGPVGCRDRHTVHLLATRGIPAAYTKCLTLTLPRRDVRPAQPKVFLVDADLVPVPDSLRARAVVVTHRAPAILTSATRRRIAEELLGAYREHAGLVITTRLHCALPCLAMGIPTVVFHKPNDERFTIMGDLGIQTYQIPSRPIRAVRRLDTVRKQLDRRLQSSVNWQPDIADITEEQNRLRSLTRVRVAEAAERVKVFASHPGAEV